jgi:hypothetical protein
MVSRVVAPMQRLEQAHSIHRSVGLPRTEPYLQFVDEDDYFDTKWFS